MSFYQTTNEKMLAKAVDELYNDYIGYNENSMMDGSEYTAFTREQLIKTIIDDVLREEKYLCLPDSWEVLEAKHIRFMGKQRVSEIVEHRVDYRRNNEGLWMWEK